MPFSVVLLFSSILSYCIGLPCPDPDVSDSCSQCLFTNGTTLWNIQTFDDVCYDGKYSSDCSQFVTRCPDIMDYLPFEICRCGSGSIVITFFNGLGDPTYDININGESKTAAINTLTKTKLTANEMYTFDTKQNHFFTYNLSTFDSEAYGLIADHSFHIYGDNNLFYAYIKYHLRYLEIYLSSSYFQSKICGLCGEFDNDPNNDLPLGSSSSSFLSKWLSYFTQVPSITSTPFKFTKYIEDHLEKSSWWSRLIKKWAFWLNIRAFVDTYRCTPPDITTTPPGTTTTTPPDTTTTTPAAPPPPAPPPLDLRRRLQIPSIAKTPSKIPSKSPPDVTGSGVRRRLQTIAPADTTTTTTPPDPTTTTPPDTTTTTPPDTTTTTPAAPLPPRPPPPPPLPFRRRLQIPSIAKTPSKIPSKSPPDVTRVRRRLQITDIIDTCRLAANDCCVYLWNEIVIPGVWVNPIRDPIDVKDVWTENCIQDVCESTNYTYTLPCDTSDDLFIYAIDIINAIAENTYPSVRNNENNEHINYDKSSNDDSESSISQSDSMEFNELIQWFSNHKEDELYDDTDNTYTMIIALFSNYLWIPISIFVVFNAICIYFIMDRDE